MTGIDAAFENFKNANLFSRIDTVHPLELFIGLDDKGRKAIELRSVFSPRKVSGTSAIEVSQYSRPEYNTIRFSLCDEEISGLFYKFCDDLIEQTRSVTEKGQGYTAILNRFFQWKKMFVSAKSSFLTESEIMGLIGEILFLKGPLADRIGLSEALKSWSGQELTHKDFSFGDTWAEVKAVSRGVPFVKIHSLEQLEGEHAGELAVFSLEKMSTAYNGVTLNGLVLKTRELFRTDEEKDAFMSEVALQGYEYNNYYDDYVYAVSDFRRYEVRDDFPRIVPENIPSAICKVSYEISLADIMEFEIHD